MLHTQNHSACPILNAELTNIFWNGKIAGIVNLYWFAEQDKSGNLTKGTTSEVDYVMAKNMQILPIEVKAGTSGKMKSLRFFMEKKDLTFGVRTSLENFSMLTIKSDTIERYIEIIPIYAIGRLTRKDAL